MNQLSPAKYAAQFFRGFRVATAATVAVLSCFATGCNKDSPESNVQSGMATSLATSDVSPSSSDAKPSNNSEDGSKEPSDNSADVQDKDSNDSPETVAAKDSSKPDQSNAEGKSLPNTDVATTVATNEPSVITETAPKKPEGTKLPKDFLEGNNLTPLNPQKTVLLDLPGKRVLLKARVCLTEGLLEMLLCPHQTKEHESILSTESQAFTVHTGLLALGCKEGKAARYDSETEEYTPASGQVIDVFLHWVDTDGKLRRERAQSWVRRSRQHYYSAEFKTLPKDLKLVPDGNLRYDDVNQYLFWYGPMTDEELAECLKMSSDGKFQAAMKQFHKDGQERPMIADWVFVGSGFYEDGDAPKQYLAEGGYMICVANFPMAMLDVSTPSDSNGTESLTYEAASEQIPPRGSEVMVELVPRPAKIADDAKIDAEKAD
tara:strand:+ start:139897 stop:141192 length:1296 start_codon:yes stop_codon:yes gene_type:complete